MSINTSDKFQQFTLSETLRVSVFLVLLLTTLAVHPYASSLALLFLCVWALIGPKQAIQALSLLALIKFLNPAIYANEGPVNILGWIVVAVAGARIFVNNLQVTWKIQSVLLCLSLFAFVILLESFFFSYYRMVSIFKVVSFIYTIVAVMLGFKASARRSFNWTPWFLGIWIAVTVLSVPVYFFPEVGFFLDEMGFQGILNHPQTFAVFLSPMVAWLMGRALFFPSKRVYWLYAMLALAWASLFLTRGRTALVALISSFIVVVMIGVTRRPEWKKLFRRAIFHPILLILVLACLAIALFQPPVVVEAVSSFIFKDVPGVSIAESFERSRGFLVVESMNNFAKNYWFGIGFGVSQSDIFPFEPIIEPLTGLPLSAPTEKPLLPVALLEETGIIGTAIFILFLFTLIKLVLSKNDLILSLVFFTCLFVNIGEMIFFSAGGMGLYIWLLMSWATYSCFERYSTATA